MTPIRPTWPAAAAVLLGLGALAGCKPQPKAVTGNVTQERASRDLARKLQAACSSPATYDRLKQVAFDQAVRIRNADPVNLQTLRASALVRVENPRVVSRDATLDVTVCSGRFVLQVPPGAERAFGGEHQLAAEIQYAAQPAADGTGLVYQLTGAEPIIYKLAAFDLQQGGAPRGPAVPPVAMVVPGPVKPDPSQLPAPAPTRAPAPRPSPPPSPPVYVGPPIPTVSRAAPPRRPAPVVTPVPERAPPPAPERSTSRPAFNCRYARTYSERLICGDDRLASLDRQMSARYFGALRGADPATRAALARSRVRFLNYREGCGSAACIADAYRDRIDEIDDIAGR